jgi:hypothetical protein
VGVQVPLLASSFAKATAGRRCRRRPDRKPCPDPIEGFIDPESHEICWLCIACGDNGFIPNWENTLWDCRGAEDSTPH